MEGTNTMKITKNIVKILFLFLLVYCTYKITNYSYSKINDKVEIKSANNLSLYDSRGNLFFQGSGNSEWVELENISQYLIDATIATEDKNFYKHHGFDFARILKATYTNITSGSTKQGASTITQQYVKNLFLTFDKTWERKWNEMWLTINVELHYDKDEILEGYLNTINYGHGVYGIENAANYYFNKNAKDLTLAESTILAGIPKSPSNYSPINNYNAAKQRQSIILNSMVKNNYISESDKSQAYNQQLTFIGKKKTYNLSTLMYYKDAVIEELEGLNNIPSSFLDTGGLKIYTALDINLQTNLENSIINNISDEELQTSGVMISPQTGSIVALVGGKSYDQSQYNRATKSVRQVGSVMKPLLYYAALENGFTSSSSFISEETNFVFSDNKTYSPQNAGGVYGNKPISLAAAIAYSDNIYAVKTHMFLGENALINISRRLGITSPLEEIPSLPLGTNEINIIEIANAYATFANKGHLNSPHLIERIEDSNGNVLYQYENTSTQVLNESLVYILNELLTTTYDSSMIDYNYPTVINTAAKMTRKYSVKSGTTNTDSWTIGYTPSLVTAVWAGYDNNKLLNNSLFSTTKNIWIDTMESSLKDTSKEWYDMPTNVVGVLVDPIAGTQANLDTTKKRILYYLKGTEPSTSEMVFDEKFN